MKLVDDDGKDVEQGEVGEIAITGENVMKGYWGREDATEEAIPDGWFLSGDMAKQDEDGYFFIVDRKKDLIIRGGYNVYPREVEEALYEHEAVAEVAVVGDPARRPGRGGRRRRRAQGRPEGRARTSCRRSPRSGSRPTSTPAHLWIVDELPKGPTGKILRREVSAPDDEATHERRHEAAARAGRRRGCARPSRPTRRAATPLDLLLGDAARSPLRRFLPGMSGVRFTAGLARRPSRVAGRAARPRAPSWPRSASAAPSSRRTRRTAASPRRAGRRTRCSGARCRATSPSGEAARGLVEDADLGWGDDQRMGFIVDNLVEASAPSNNPFLNPKVLKRIVDTGGGNLVEGGRRFVRDFASAAAGALDGRARRVRGRHRHRGHARARWCCAPRCSS